MAIGTSLGAYFDDEFHHQAGINTDPSQDRIDVNPDTDLRSPKLDILPVDKKEMPFPNNRNPDSDFTSRFGNLPPSGILNDLKRPDPDRPLLRRISDVTSDNGEPPQKAPDYDYDAYKKAFPDKEITSESHGPDTFKLPNHITFSNESMYHSDETPGGRWDKKDDGSWSFTPSSFNLQQHSSEELKTYFDKYEKGNELILPDSAAGMAATASEKAADALKRTQTGSGPA